MASQYKVIARVTGPTGNTQAITGKGRVRFILAVGSGSSIEVDLRDEVPAAVGSPTATPFAGIVSNNNEQATIYFDSCGGGFPLENGLHVAMTATSSDVVLYVYGS